MAAWETALWWFGNSQPVFLPSRLLLLRNRMQIKSPLLNFVLGKAEKNEEQSTDLCPGEGAFYNHWRIDLSSYDVSKHKSNTSKHCRLTIYDLLYFITYKPRCWCSVAFSCRPLAPGDWYRPEYWIHAQLSRQILSRFQCAPHRFPANSIQIKCGLLARQSLFSEMKQPLKH